MNLCMIFSGRALKAKRFRRIKFLLNTIIEKDQACKYHLIYQQLLLRKKIINPHKVCSNASSFHEVIQFVFVILGKLLSLKLGRSRKQNYSSKTSGRIFETWLKGIYAYTRYCKGALLEWLSMARNDAQSNLETGFRNQTEVTSRLRPLVVFNPS